MSLHTLEGHSQASSLSLLPKKEVGEALPLVSTLFEEGGGVGHSRGIHKPRLHDQVPNPDSNLNHNPHGGGGLSLDLNPVCFRVNATNLDQDLDQNPRTINSELVPHHLKPHLHWGI